MSAMVTYAEFVEAVHEMEQEDDRGHLVAMPTLEHVYYWLFERAPDLARAAWVAAHAKERARASYWDGTQWRPVTKAAAFFGWLASHWPPAVGAAS